METEAPSFSPDLFVFLRDIAANNDREWFAENKPRYVADVQEPALAFVEDVGLRLPSLSGHFVADTRANGGSLYRIYRDTRFSKDKTPYKTHTGIHFRHERAKDAHAPGYYLHLEPGRVFLGCGIWRPDSDAVRAIRTAIASHPDRWRSVVGGEPFADRFRLAGEALKRPPAGFDRDHPLIEDLKRKDFIATAELSEAAVTSPGFLTRFLDLCDASADFMRFLCGALRVPF
jgi:uncharacterized protein (TIGR02453 family)